MADLLSVLALPVMWAGTNPSRIAQVLVDSLVGMLHLDVAYVWLRTPSAVELLRAAAPIDLRGLLNARLGNNPEAWPVQACRPIREGELGLLPVALGLQAQGVLVVGSDRSNFPTESELLILRVAANQAAVGLKEMSAQQELSRGVAYREQMMAILGHDLRSPLSAVTGLSGLLMLDQTLSPRAKEGLGRMQQAATRMSEMIETILDFTRIRFGGRALPISRSEMDMGELCRDLITEALAVDGCRTISIEVSGDLRGSWDSARLAQVVSNLLTNALTHGDAQQGVRLVVTGDIRFVNLDVVNRGPTLPAEQLDTIFEPFVSRAHRRSGLGLGLYIARQVVTSHGGTLTARSSDETTTFSMVLPRSP
jgi:signal transduction histidine kinase